MAKIIELFPGNDGETKTDSIGNKECCINFTEKPPVLVKTSTSRNKNSKEDKFEEILIDEEDNTQFYNQIWRKVEKANAFSLRNLISNLN